MHANQTDIQKILGGVQQYVIPLFQRPYSWDTKQWNILWDDLLELCEEEKPRNHFIGSIVTMPSRSVPEGVSKYVLIDGQQRLTTLLLILAALREKARSQENKLADKIDDLLLKNRHQDDNDIYKLLPTQYDRTAFCSLMDGPSASTESQINRAFDFYEKKLRLNGTLDLEKLYTVIGKNLVLVSIVLDKEDNPYLIFESLNAKGRPLTQADLIRNFFFMRIHLNQQEEVFEKHWKPMQQQLGENLTEFIRHFLMREGHIIKQSDVYFSLKESVESRPDNGDGTAFLKELARLSKYYGRLLRPTEEPNLEIAARLARLNRIEATTTYPFLLNAYDDVAKGRLSEADLVEILATVETFLIRRFVCSIPTNQLSKIFVVLYSQASKVQPLLHGVRSVLQDREFPRDRLFTERLTTFRLYGGGDRLPRTRLILECLEQSFAHKEPILLDKLTIEHVMPQTLSERWKNDLGENWELIHETWLHTVGNLTLTGYNPDLSNSDYSTKRELLLKSHIELSRSFKSEEKWDEHSIGRRASMLAEQALKIWPDFANGQGQLPFDAPDDDDDDLEDVQLLKRNILEKFGGESERTGNPRYQIHRVKDGRIINIKYSKLHKDYYWFGVHASLWEDCLKSGVTHLVLILGKYGFIALPTNVVKDYLAEANSTPKQDGSVRHYHLQVTKEPEPELFHYGNPKRIPVEQYLSRFGM